jgi:hypothetical protein
LAEQRDDDVPEPSARRDVGDLCRTTVPRGVSSKRTEPALSMSEPSSERQLIRSPGTSSTIWASHSYFPPREARRLGDPVRALVINHADLFDVRHDARQVVELAPEVVALLRDFWDRERLPHADAARELLSPPRLRIVSAVFRPMAALSWQYPVAPR